MKCTFPGVQEANAIEITFVTNTAEYGQMTVFGAFGTRKATSFMQGNFLVALEALPIGTTSTLIYIKPGEDIVALRSTEFEADKSQVAVGESNILTSAMRGNCAMFR
ncbi:hypothetical protein [Mesorhizobium huakuii]|uniref:Uncharacterized protein n=1 Tax=Mesorhizobium huakuii TaxID=28104 RepID=A0A7G6SQ24_9HYPH|nr:hypothetical protein [Mesorhizobium huakuii]QND56606.1 hypothetical protein HB778_08270 [Mesorhizobium huakuii]